MDPATAIAVGSLFASLIRRFAGIGRENPLVSWTDKQLLAYFHLPWGLEHVAYELRPIFESYPWEVRRYWTLEDVSNWRRGGAQGAAQAASPEAQSVPQVATSLQLSLTETGPPSLATLEPTCEYMASQFIQGLRSVGFTVVLTSARRTWQEQLRLWLEYVMGRSKYPAARPGSSSHEKGFAFDLSVQYEGQQLTGAQLEEVGTGPFADYFWLKWGGPKDPVHYELQVSSLAQAYIREGRNPPSDILGPVYSGTP